jgi:hypothetical protein
VEEAKKKAKEKGIENWKALVKAEPPKLEPKLKKLISQMYMAAANEITRKRMFAVPKLADIIKNFSIT